MKRTDITDAEDKKMGRRRFFYPCPPDVSSEWFLTGDWRLDWTPKVCGIADRILSGYPTEVAKDRNIHLYPMGLNGSLGFSVHYIAAPKKTA